nr:hypothetical protein [Oscillospiraceae bacterium]
MKDIMFKGAGVISAVIFLVIVLVVYGLLATVTLVYEKGECEAFRQDGVNVVTEIEDPSENLREGLFAEGEEAVFTYTSGNETKTFDPENPVELKLEIAKTVIINLFTFKWDEGDNVIILTAK